MASAVGFSEENPQKMVTLRRVLGGSKQAQRPPFGSGRPPHSVPGHFYRPVRRTQTSLVPALAVDGDAGG